MVKKSFIDNPVVSSIVFFPRKSPEPTLLDSNTKILKLKISKNIITGGFFYLNDYDFPTILLFHGNGEIAADYQYFLDFFFDCGVNLAVVDFRGYGFSSGEPIYSSLITDAMPIYNEFYKWLIEENLKDSLFLLGRSLGSACASEIGAHNPNNLRGIIFESGFASMYNMMTRLFRVSGPGITPEGLSEYSNDT
ncbi:MAG: alpha/beta fold hydrolase, partial [Candidatus Hodarchaeota archaeon]